MIFHTHQSVANWISLFYNPKYSDLAVKLSDDREIKLHKNIVCIKNAYFNKLCGEGSQFAVSHN